MLYLGIWAVVALLLGHLTFTFGSGGVFWSFIVALVLDIFWNGYYRPIWRRP